MSYKSILIIKPSSLGDIVHTLPAVAAIREANPTAKITWVINPEWAPLLRGNRDVDHVHIFPRGEFRGLGAPRSLLPWLKKTRALRSEVRGRFPGVAAQRSHRAFQRSAEELWDERRAEGLPLLLSPRSARGLATLTRWSVI
jgi:hypothetical protein